MQRIADSSPLPPFSLSSSPSPALALLTGALPLTSCAFLGVVVAVVVAVGFQGTPVIIISRIKIHSGGF